MRLSVSTVVTGLMILTASAAGAQTPVRADISEINTSGRGEIRIAPDRATVLVTIETHASSAAAASSANSELTNSTINFFLVIAQITRLPFEYFLRQIAELGPFLLQI